MRHSIFLRITLFFLITFIGMGVGFYAIHEKLTQEHEHQLEIEAGNLLLVLRKSIVLSLPMRYSFLQEQGYSVTEPRPELIKSLRNALRVTPENYPEAVKDSIKEGRIQILRDDNHLYIYLTKATPPLLVFKADAAKQSLLPETLFITLMVALLLLYWLIIKTLFPLKHLIQSINRYGKEGIYTPIKSTKKDEIALVTYALDGAMHKNQTLLEARRLFLRNIMHELKTPITVGKLSLPFLKKGEERSILERAFFRMEHLIAELVRVEQITSGALSPHLQVCNPKFLADKAKELLFLKDEAIEAVFDGEMIYADCEVFVTVFKNLIDNAIKYSDEGKVRIVQKHTQIFFYNKGAQWPSGYTLKSLSEPFFHSNDNPNSFGLGLYLVKSIIDAHNFKLFYRYEAGEHCFGLECQSSL
jgi:two-component system OmpR family sensor kinase